MIKLVELLKLHNVTDQEINNLVIMSHTEKQDKKKSVGKSITAYDLWRSDHDNRKQDELKRDLDTGWEYFNRTHGKGALYLHKFLLSFVEIPITKDLIFTGFYKIIDRKPVEEGAIHPVQQTPMEGKEENILEYDHRLKEFEGKLILGGWGIPKFQNGEIVYKKNPQIKRILANYKDQLFVKALIQEIPEHKFSYQSFLWSTKRISKLPSSWQYHLSQLFGVYLLVDKNGNQYVGSASSREGGLLSRWKYYEKTGHGGNKQLKKLKKEQQVYTVSILETAPSSYSKNLIIELENTWKEKLGTRAFGLNSN